MGRYKKIAALAAGIALIFIFLPGCERMLEREFYSVSKHDEHKQAPSLPDDGISDYYDLKNAILNLVRSGVSEKLIRISSYSGSLDEDLRNISKNLLEQDALTAYTVSSIVYEQTRILTYQEVLITIHYSKTEQDTEKIIDVINTSDFERKASQELAAYPGKLVFLFGYYYDAGFQISDRFLKAYYNNPDAAYGLSGYKAQLYPESGTQRIAEITIEYLDSPEKLAEKSGQAAAKAAEIAAEIKNDDKAVAAIGIYRYLLKNVEFDSQAMRVVSETGGTQPKSDPYTAFGALVSKTAAPEGYALSFKKLCDLAGIDCTVIFGTLKDKTPVVWDLIKLGGHWYHIDPAMAAMEGNESGYFCLNDEAMGKTHEWNADSYPAADGTEYSYDAVVKSLQK